VTATADQQAWLYHFTRVPPIVQSEELLSYHGAEIVYVMGKFHLASFDPTPEDKALTDAMSNYWVNFAATGDPNGPGLPEWPAYHSKSGAYMRFGDTVGSDIHLLEKESDFFEHFNAVERARD